MAFYSNNNNTFYLYSAFTALKDALHKTKNRGKIHREINEKYI